MNYVYMVQFEWSTTDADGIETELFSDYDKAYARYQEVIANELNPEMSWVGDQAFDENGKINEDYELDEGDYVRNICIGTSWIKTTTTVIRLSTLSKRRCADEEHERGTAHLNGYILYEPYTSGTSRPIPTNKRYAR